MNCHEVEPFLDQFVRPSNIVDPQQTEIQKHLAACSTCQSLLRHLDKWDDQFHRAMNDVSIPEGLKQRLGQALQQAATSDVVKSPVIASRGLGLLRSKTVALLVIVVLVGASMWWSRGLLLPTRLLTSDVTAMLQQSIQDLPELNSDPDRLPRQWSALRGQVHVGSWKQIEAVRGGLRVAALPIEIRPPRSQPIEGVLFAIPKSRWAPPTSASASLAQIQYSSPFVWIVWSEDNFVFILAVNGSTQMLEHLQHQLNQNHSVL